MDLTPLLDASGYAIYGGLALAALFGVFSVILLARRVSQKRLSGDAAERFREEVQDALSQHRFEAVAEICDSPPYWAKAVPQLMLVALREREMRPMKLRQLLADRFERDVLADLEYGLSWINTIVKSAPMLGLLGTVVGMISAFGKIASMQESGGDPGILAGEISFALFTTALGLTVAIPLVVMGAWIQVRIGKLQDSVQDLLTDLLDDLERATTSKA